MKRREILTMSLTGMLCLLCSCSESIEVSVLPEPENITIPQAVALSEEALFGVWGATTAYGTHADNHFEQAYEIAFQNVEDGEAVYSHWYTDASSEARDSVCGVEYIYTFDGSTVSLTPKSTYAANGARPIKAVHLGNNRLMLLTLNESKTDTICTLLRKGDPVPSITNVDRTLPQVGETVTITGRNLQFVDHIYLPTVDGEIEVTPLTIGSKEIKMVVPDADYAAGSIRCQSTSAGESCYSPAYMFCEDCVFFHNFNNWGTKTPYTGSEFEYSISSMGTIRGNAVYLDATKLPEGHSLSQTDGIIHPDSLLSLFGNTPTTWAVAANTNTFNGYLRFSSGDRFQYVLDHCDGLLTSRTPCADVAIQMDIYVSTNGQPEWNTGYMSYRMNKDQNALTSSMVANVAGWQTDAPMSFADGWKTFTIPLTAFPVTASSSTSTLGGLIATLLNSNLQTILCLVNYPMDNIHPAQAVDAFQFSIANIRLVPYRTPANTKE